MPPKKNKVHQPDDAFFKKILGLKENAKAYLLHFHPEIAEEIDLETLDISSNSFLDDNLNSFSADLIYQCRFKESKEGFYLSILFEHKSFDDDFVSIQVGTYILQAYYKMSKDKSQELTPIIPIIFYNGNKEWYPPKISELFQEHPNFEFFSEYVPDFKFIFKNIGQTAKYIFLALQLDYLRSALMAMAYRFRQDLLLENISIIFDVEDQSNLTTIANYYMAIIDRSPKKIQEAIKDIDFKIKSNVMSTLERLLQEGKEIGKEIGKLEGQKEEALKNQFLRLQGLFKIMEKFKDLQLKEYAELSLMPVDQIKEFQSLSSTLNFESILNKTKTLFFEGWDLNEKEEEKLALILKAHFRTKQ